MAESILTLRMKYRNYSIEKLQELANSKLTDMQRKVVEELIAKKGGGVAQTEQESSEAKPTPKKKVAKKQTEKTTKNKEEVEEEVDAKDGSREASIARQNKVTTNYQSEEQLTPEEEKRLEEAEKEFEARQENRKSGTPIKPQKGMKEGKATKAEKAERKSKREDLQESSEIKGIKIGSTIVLKDGSGERGTITRIYRSSDGKEKCMVKFESEKKAIKKRTTTLELCGEE